MTVFQHIIDTPSFWGAKISGNLYYADTSYGASSVFTFVYIASFKHKWT